MKTIFFLISVIWCNISFSQVSPFNNSILQVHEPGIKSTGGVKKLGAHGLPAGIHFNKLQASKYYEI